MDVFNSVSRQDPASFLVHVQHRGEVQSRPGRLLAYQLLPSFNPCVTTSMVPPTLSAVIQDIIMVGLQNLRQNLTMAWVPEHRRARASRSVAAPPAAAAIQDISKGKNNTTKHSSASVSASSPAFCVPLLQGVCNGKRINLRLLLRAASTGASPTIKKGETSTPVCLRALCQKFGGGCKEASVLHTVPLPKKLFFPTGSGRHDRIYCIAKIGESQEANQTD